MLGQFLGIDVIEHQADSDFLKTIQESFYHVMNVDKQFAIPVLWCRRWYLSDVQDWPSTRGVSLIIQRPALLPLEKCARQLKLELIEYLWRYLRIRFIECCLRVPEWYKYTILLKFLLSNSHKGRRIFEIPSVSVVQPFQGKSHSPPNCCGIFKAQIFWYI
jgi:hypothetical protein